MTKLRYSARSVSAAKRQLHRHRHRQQPVSPAGLASSLMRHWRLGEWEKLSEVPQRNLVRNPERAKLAVLVASAHQQLNNLDGTAQFARAAMAWGADHRLVAKALSLGVHLTLATAAAARQDSMRSDRHFAAAQTLHEEIDPDGADGIHSIRQLSRSGLLVEAAKALNARIQSLQKSPYDVSRHQARITSLETEMELLQGALSLAQRRLQVLPTTPVQNSSSFMTAPHGSLKARSMSQLGQDLWVLAQTEYKRDGFFVEFGATDGVLLSNTYLLEREFSWNGICAEPNPKFFRKLQENRACLTSNACLAGVTGQEVEFIFADAYGGIADYADDDMHAAKREAYRQKQEVSWMTTISLHDFLTQNAAPRHIDYLSIDTEGSEFDILNAFPFDKWRIEYITVEHNFTARRADIRALLEGNGYTCLEQEWDDWYSLHKNNHQ